MYSSSTAEPLHFAQAVSFLRRVISDADYGSMLYTYVGPVSCAYACDSKITGRAYTPRVSGILTEIFTILAYDATVDSDRH